jgi:uncharacterized protein (DUF58 family)
MALFDSEFLKKLEYLSLVSKRVFRGQLLAQRRTVQMGGGVEFADHRDYSPGDDFRYLDWNVFARHGDLLLKRFQEEEDLHVYLFLDCSRSMEFGDPVKFDYARQVTAALAYIALADLDRVSVIAFADRIIDTFPLTRGRDCILTLLRFLEGLEPQGKETDLGRVARDFIARGNRSGLAIIVSDLFDPHGFQRGIDLIRHRRYEPTLVQMYDPAEANPNVLGDIELLDMETDLRKKVTINERNLSKYKEVFAQFLESVKTYSRSYGLGCAQTVTQVPFDELILRMMRTAGSVS